MKMLVFIALVFLTANTALADHNADQAKQEVYEAKATLDAALEQLPSEIGAYVYKTFREVDRKLDTAINYLNQVSATPVTRYCPVTKWTCSMPSSFDGSFSGEGYTEVQAKADAHQACKEGSRSKGFHCEPNETACDSYTTQQVCGQ